MPRVRRTRRDSSVFLRGGGCERVGEGGGGGGGGGGRGDGEMRKRGSGARKCPGLIAWALKNIDGSNGARNP